MKRLFIILLFPFVCYGQTDTCFTEEQIIDISYTIDSLYALDSINTEIIARYEEQVESYKCCSSFSI